MKLSHTVKTLSKSFAHKLGLEVSKNNTLISRDAFEAQATLINKLGINQPIIFDVGAFQGTTVRKYKTLCKNSVVYAFEPFPDSFAVLQNRYADDASVKLFPLVMADKVGRREFFINHMDSTHSILPRPSGGVAYYPEKAKPKTRIEVGTTHIDQFILEQQLSKIDILKMDIQGAELIALQGAQETLQQQKIELIYLEIMAVPHYEGAPLFYEVWSFLQKFNYTLFDIYNLKRARNGQLRMGDALFVSERLRTQVIDRLPT